MAFRYQAIDGTGQQVVDVVDVPSMADAADYLRERGLFVTQLEPDDGRTALTKTTPDDLEKAVRRVRFRDVVLFTQQMSMMLRSGARVVEALEAVEEQSSRPAWRQVLAAVRFDVQEGRALSVALSRFPTVFSGIFISMVTAGEASGELGIAFDRLGAITRQQQEIRTRVIGALSYPAGLLLLCSGVLTIMLTFVLPRFADMFAVLDVPLPLSTKVLIAMSTWCWGHWPVVVGVVAAVAIGTILFLRSASGQRCLSRLVVRVPVFGRLVRSIALARICRIWGQLLQSKVGLLDAVELIRRGTTNYDFQLLLDRIIQAVTHGSAVGPVLRSSWMIPRTYAGALATGEESGRFADALLFVGNALEEQNVQVLASLSRIIEPLILAIMGLVIGVIAFSLFLPMFDMATVAG